MALPTILANGSFPTHAVPLALLREASPLVCCDGAANQLIRAGMMPEVVIGDLDSIKAEFRYRFSEIMIQDTSQDTNDLTKAMEWCRRRGFDRVTILGATGEREDHTLANIALLARYNRELRADIVSDYGIFRVIRTSSVLPSFPGQQISIFSLSPDTALVSRGLKYPLNGMILRELWQGSLNEAEGESFALEFDAGELVVYSLHAGI